MINNDSVECWQVWEIGAVATNVVEATFSRGDRAFVSEAFDVGGRKLVRFSPDEPGDWNYQLRSADAVVMSGTFTCTPASADNHGPVRVTPDGRFAYADGTPFHPFGTAALWWHEQSEDAVAATLDTLARAPWTRVRMSVLPADLDGWPEPKHLDRVESGVVALRDLGLEAELVLFGAGDDSLRAALPDEGWQSYVRQTVARFAAYRNVSWCITTDADRSGVDGAVWDEVLALVAECDYGHHLLTMHADAGFNFGRRLITHSSVRHHQARIASALTTSFAKPVVLDSIGMEGNAPDLDAALTAEDLVSRIWEAVCRGGYASHGESFVEESPWWSHGGRLTGESGRRIAFLREILDSAPPGLRYSAVDHDASTLEAPGQFYLQYYGIHQFRSRRFDLPAGEFRVEIIDTWNMTIREVRPQLSGEFVLDLPGRLYYAVRIVRC